MRKGYLRQDWYGDWYFVSAKLISSFDKLLKDVESCEDVEDRRSVANDFLRIFGGFRLQYEITDIEFGME